MAFSGPVFSPLKNPLQEELKDFVKVCISFISNFEVIVIIVYFSVREFVIKDWVSGVFVDLRSSFSGMNTRVRYQFLKISYDHRVFLFLFECFLNLKGSLFVRSKKSKLPKLFRSPISYKLWFRKLQNNPDCSKFRSKIFLLIKDKIFSNTRTIVDTFASSSKIH